MSQDPDKLELAERRKKSMKGKLQAMGRQSEILDPHTMYVYGKDPMPSRLILNRYRASTAFEWFATPPTSAKGMRITEGLVAFHEAVMSGFAAVPDVAVDVDDGTYSILFGDNRASGGLDDIPEET
jgi:hypothetical protein